MSASSGPSEDYVLDACALLAFLQREPGAEVVDTLLSSPNPHCYVHVVNLCEVYYDFVRSSGHAIAKEVVADLLAAGVVDRRDLDTEFWQQAADLKVDPGKLSLADCFALALARRLGATLVTSDHHEFDPIAQSGLTPILFIR